MKEIIAVIRMNRTNAMKRALVEAGVVGFTATRVLGRGKLVDDPAVIAERRERLLALAGDEVVEPAETEQLVDGFLDGSRLFPRRLFTIMAHDGDVPRIVDAIMKANRTTNKVGDGKIFVLPVLDAVRVRTGEAGDAAL